MTTFELTLGNLSKMFLLPSPSRPMANLVPTEAFSDHSGGPQGLPSDPLILLFSSSLILVKRKKNEIPMYSASPFGSYEPFTDSDDYMAQFSHN